MAWMQILIGLLQISFAQDIHGHRGARAIYPENIMAGFEYALLFGADYIEVDTHYTKDGVVVIHHDASVNKDICTNADGSNISQKIVIYKTELKDLQKFDCGSKLLSSFPRQIAVPGAKIPTLQEVMLLFRFYSILNPYLRLNIEIKFDTNNNYPAMAEYVDAIIELVEKNQLQEFVIYQSFSKDVVGYIRRKESEAVVYFLNGNPFTNYLNVLRDTGADGVSLAYGLVSESAVTKVRAMGRKILSWTVNEKRDWQKLISLGIDGIITDDPEGLYQYRNEVSSAAHLIE